MSDFILRGKGFYLKPLVDVVCPERLSECLNDEDLTQYMLDLPYPYTVDDGEEFLSYLKSEATAKTSLELGIVNDNNEFMGVMSFASLNRQHFNGEIGYWLRKEYQGQGIAYHAAQVLIKYGFEDLELKRIYAYVQKDNLESIKLLEKLGLEQEGLLRQAGFHRGRFIDRLVYAIIRE